MYWINIFRGECVLNFILLLTVRLLSNFEYTNFSQTFISFLGRFLDKKKKKIWQSYETIRIFSLFKYRFFNYVHENMNFAQTSIFIVNKEYVWKISAFHEDKFESSWIKLIVRSNT